MLIMKEWETRDDGHSLPCLYLFIIKQAIRRQQQKKREVIFIYVMLMSSK